HVLAEVEARGTADAVDRPPAVLAEVDLVQVRLEDLLLRVAQLEADREHRLARLAPPGAFGREVDVLHQLLRERAAALDHPAAARVLERGGRGADRIDPGMPEEAAVL